MTKQIITIGDASFISEMKLLEFASKKTIDNGRSLRKKGKTELYNSVELGGELFFEVESLSSQLIKKIGDIGKIETSQLIDEAKQSHPIVEYNTEILLILEFAYMQKRFWTRYVPLYQDRFYTTDELTVYCKTHSFIKSIFGLEKEGHKLQDIFEVYVRIRNKMELYNFDVGSYDYFCSKLAKLSIDKLEITLLHGNKGAPKHFKKRTNYHEKLMLKFYAQPKPNMLTYQEITDRVNNEVMKKGLKPIDLSTTKQFLGNPEIQNTYKPFRIGPKWAETHLEPYLNRTLPKDVHDKWEMDGKCLPFYVLVDDKGTMGRLWVVFIVDVHSRRIIGYCVGRYETRFVCLEAYRQAIVGTQHIPFELVRDNAKAYESELIREFEAHLEDNYPTIIRPARPGNSKDKGTIEAVIKILGDKYFSKHQGFLGDGWGSTREEFRLEPELRKEYYKKQNAKTSDEIKIIIEQSFTKYNETIF